ncbi:MAG TPA: alpha/beta hydrolase, partial [Candidatus Limnocylindrales bacterium]|nr:alpha/beta hydrolase [Candidatus Limnocylindrales bacterium]
LYVIDEGARTDPPVVLLHAGIADTRSWDAVSPSLLDAGYRVVRYDMRGAGQTRSEEMPFSRVADLLAVMDACAIERAALVGNSMGGMTAVDAAIAEPDRVTAVVTVAAGLGGFDGASSPLEDELFAEMDRRESAVPPDPQAIADIDIQVWVDGPGQPPGRVPAAVRDLVRAMDTGGYEPGHEVGDVIRLDRPAAVRLDELRCPVLAVAGALDVSEVVQVARHLEANAPDARAVVWPDVAHMIGMEVPDRLAALIVDFLRPLPRWS